MELAPEWFAETIVSARPGYPFLIHEEALEIPWGKRRRKGQPLNLEMPVFILLFKIQQAVEKLAFGGQKGYFCGEPTCNLSKRLCPELTLYH
jgi:hypothetical protein